MKILKRQSIASSKGKCLRGQATTEYLLLTAAVGLVMFLPFENNGSLADYLALAIRSFFRNYSFLLSVF